MARENAFTFIGQVLDVPVALLNEATDNYRITFTLVTVRQNGRSDYPRISVYDLTREEAKDYVEKMKPGVFMILRGMVSTKVIKKKVRCEECGKVCLIDTIQTEIISFGKPYVMKEKPNPSEIVEFANRGFVLGTACTPVYRKDGDVGNKAAQFQMSISRKYHTRDMKTEIRTDYPWVKVFSKVAEQCLKRLRVGSQIYASCYFQTRDIKRHVKCNYCSSQLVFDERVSELVPMSVEFLNNCLFEKQSDDENTGVENEE